MVVHPLETHKFNVNRNGLSAMGFNYIIDYAFQVGRAVEFMTESVVILCLIFSGIREMNLDNNQREHKKCIDGWPAPRWPSSGIPFVSPQWIRNGQAFMCGNITISCARRADHINGI